MHDAGCGGFEGLAGVPGVEDGGADRYFAAPDGERGILGGTERR